MNGSYLVAAVVAVTLAIVTAQDRPIAPVPTRCPAFDSSNYTVHLAHEWDCTKFYKCLNGERILQICPLKDRLGNRLHFNRVLQVCDSPQSAGCTGSDPTYPTVPPTRPPPSKVCPPKGSGTIIFLPHECLCDRYYICVDGNQIGRVCPDGYHWDRNNWVCTTPEMAKCPNWRPMSAEPKPPPMTKLVPYRPVPQGQPVCPVRGSSDIVYLPHECHCDRYYICIDGNSFLQVCPSDYHWDRANWVCTTPDKAKCVWNPTLPPPPTSPPTPPPTTPTTPTTPGPVPTGCPPADFIGLVYLPHEFKCEWYYICIRGNPVIQVCPTGFHWDRSNWVCTTPEKAKCPNLNPIPTLPTPPTPEPTTPKPLPTSCPPRGSTDIVYLPHECVCDRYYFCINGNPLVQLCPTGYHWDRVNWICTTPDRAKCVNWHPTSAESRPHPILGLMAKLRPNFCPPRGATNLVYLPHECTCEKFYLCVEGSQMLKYCPDGMHWDRLRWRCTTPIEAQCLDVEPTGATSKPTTKPPGECDIDDIVIRFIPDPTECSRYYECNLGAKIPHTCPKGLHFHPILEICDWPKSAKCDKNALDMQ